VWVVRIFGAVNAEAPEMGGFFSVVGPTVVSHSKNAGWGSAGDSLITQEYAYMLLHRQRETFFYTIIFSFLLSSFIHLLLLSFDCSYWLSWV
jgi:hypothetical protein